MNIREHLRKLGTGEIQPLAQVYGICFELDRLLKHVQITDQIMEQQSKWPHYSGNSGYPIRHPEGGTPPDAYYAPEFPNWGPERYGSRRRELCLFLADNWPEDLNEYHEPKKYRRFI